MTQEIAAAWVGGIAGLVSVGLSVVAARAASRHSLRARRWALRLRNLVALAALAAFIATMIAVGRDCYDEVGRPVPCQEAPE